MPLCCWIRWRPSLYLIKICVSTCMAAECICGRARCLETLKWSFTSLCCESALIDFAFHFPLLKQCHQIVSNSSVTLWTHLKSLGSSSGHIINSIEGDNADGITLHPCVNPLLSFLILFILVLLRLDLPETSHNQWEYLLSITQRCYAKMRTQILGSEIRLTS